MIQASHIAPEPLDIFRERCAARAYLVEIGDLAFLDTVDGLQCDAEFDGLPDQYGADAVQAVMAAAFGGTR